MISMVNGKEVAMIVGAVAVVGTLIHRHFTGEWWWSRFFPQTTPIRTPTPMRNPRTPASLTPLQIKQSAKNKQVREGLGTFKTVQYPLTDGTIKTVQIVESNWSKAGRAGPTPAEVAHAQAVSGEQLGKYTIT